MTSLAMPSFPIKNKAAASRTPKSLKKLNETTTDFAKKISFHSFIQLNTGRVGNSIIRRYTQTEQKPFGCVPEEPQENQFYSDDDSRSDFGTMSEISHFTTQSRDVHLDDVEPDIQEMIDFKEPVYSTKASFSLLLSDLLGKLCKSLYTNVFISEVYLTRGLNLFDSIVWSVTIKLIYCFGKLQVSDRGYTTFFRLPTKIKHFPTTLNEFLMQILGFFAIEDHIHHTTKNIGNRPERTIFSSTMNNRPADSVVNLSR